MIIGPENSNSEEEIKEIFFRKSRISVDIRLKRFKMVHDEKRPVDELELSDILTEMSLVFEMVIEKLLSTLENERSLDN